MLQIDVGDGSVAAPDLVSVAVSPGQTVNIANLSGATLNYFLNGIDGAVSTLTAGNNVNVTIPTWMQVIGGVTTVLLSGGAYG